ncbi:acetyl-CoA carboxylase biotin carboxyl carrier protein [Geovibrio thiophilus]|uniref:Biotin carboxyl carrier protein of acetyl-CoA carboxylase n=1 Tax=Geovibrio thiophilus TaxID=139438 RepID=A0A410K1K0_9BACT|nr:acetyl-CoA carboxylase biotin carboxyl carrier protein [Geovibrio thiophilus]QAR34274.1 acetyl-CoA carboxylase biotin carboxyl carrier protein [Geovibrio thiophilus]
MELKDIRELIRFIDKSEIKEFEYETENGERIYISKKDDAPVFAAAPAAAYAQAPAAPAALPAAAPTAEVKDSGLKGNQVEIKTPIVGTFYEAPSPGAESFVKEGDTVKKGQTLCIVEAMKIMNEIEAEFDCKIVRKVGQNAKPVEYGEVIFIAEPL